MLVLGVGLNTQFGILKKTTLTNAEAREQTPLQNKLTELADTIGRIGFEKKY